MNLPWYSFTGDHALLVVAVISHQFVFFLFARLLRLRLRSVSMEVPSVTIKFDFACASRWMLLLLRPGVLATFLKLAEKLFYCLCSSERRF